jgi:putative Ca2+/H+ antiporter (TMEM165/GDT1 family)
VAFSSGSKQWQQGVAFSCGRIGFVIACWPLFSALAAWGLITAQLPPELAANPAPASFASSLTAITLAELGDKTFFMALILAARHRPRWVYLGAFSALAAVTLISLGLGYGLRELIPATVIPWLAAALFLGFGIKLLLDAQGLASDAAAEEEKEAEAAVNQAELQKPIVTPWAVIWESFALVFIAELGDRTQFATILLATAPAFSFGGLLAGTLVGHALVTGLAVGAGNWIGGRISELWLYRLSGGLFLAFGLASLVHALAG